MRVKAVVRRPTRFVPYRPRVVVGAIPSDPAKDSIYLAGGVGDYLAIDSFLPDEFTNRLRIIYTGTSAGPCIAELARAAGYPKLEEVRVHMEDWPTTWQRCYWHKHDYMKVENRLPGVEDAVDCSVPAIFPSCRSGRLPFRGSRFRDRQLADVSRLNLPDRYVVIVPRSSNKGRDDRDFHANDWLATSNYYRRLGIPAVVVFHGEELNDVAKDCLNLSNQLHILEAAEVVKRASMFIGVDTCWTVLAAKMGYPMFVKGSGGLFRRFFRVYYAPDWQKVAGGADLPGILSRASL